VQVGFRPVSTLPVPAAYRRDELDARRQPAREQAVGEQQSQQQTTGEVTRIRTRASVAAQRAETQAPQFADNLPARSRNAVAAYSSNGPSIEERLGVELVGVDLYV
jgi:hypothetical protein